MKPAVSVRKYFLRSVDVKNNGISKMILSHVIFAESFIHENQYLSQKFLCFLLSCDKFTSKNGSDDLQPILWKWVTYIFYDCLLTMNHNLELQKHNFTSHLLQIFLTIK